MECALLGFFMEDEMSLERYLSGKDFDMTTWKNYVMEAMRKRMPFMPLHYFDLWREQQLDNLQTLPQIFFKGLTLMVSKYLWLDHQNYVRIKPEQMNNWQLLICGFSPLVLVSLFIWKKKQDGQLNIESIIDKNFKYTALPTAKKDVLENLKDIGLADTHIHLGSAEESDVSWIKARENPRSTINLKRLSECTNRYDRQLLVHNDYDFCNIMLMAKDIQQSLCKKLPIISCKTLSDESNFIVAAMDYIFTNKKDCNFAQCLHKYLLIMGYVRKLLTMQNYQIGLRSFNTILHSSIRGKQEWADGSLLCQLTGNELDAVQHIELRIGDCKWIEDLKRGLKELNGKQQKMSKKQTSMSFVASITKPKMKKHNKSSRNKAIKEINECTRLTLANLEFVAGVDFTGADMNCPPEMFVESVKLLRGKDFHHFTYHAGEDFIHILDGLRTIFEVVSFLRFDDRCRIGHASAAGVDPLLWADNIGDIFPIRQGEYLDDLVFAWYVLSFQFSIHNEELERRIKELSNNVYGKTYEPQILYDAWLLRGIFAGGTFYKGSSSMTGIEMLHSMYLEGNNCKYDKIIDITPFEVVNVDDIVSIQQYIMRTLVDKGIAVEANPTSNVVIGHHKDFKSYHLKTWEEWRKIGVPIPQITLGTDETGIFATNLENEYANVFCCLNEDARFQGNTINIVNNIAKASKARVF